MKRCLCCMEEYEESVSPVCPFCGRDGSVRCVGRDGLDEGEILQGRYIVGDIRRTEDAYKLYIGWDALFNRKVLIMEYSPRSCIDRQLSNYDDIVEYSVIPEKEKLLAKGARLFLANGEGLISLDDTKGLLNVYSVFPSGEFAYMTMEYPGELTLRKVLEEKGPRPLEEVEEMVRSLAVALSAAHSLRFAHGNLSLDCCYQVAPGQYKVGCFNEAAYVTGDIPELKGGAKDVRPADRDVYQLAWIAGCALLGIENWESHPVGQNLERLAEDVPEYVVDALDRALQEKPSGGRISVRRFIDLFADEATIEILSMPDGSEKDSLKGGKGKKNRSLINMRR